MPTKIFIILDIFSGIKLDNIVPNTATNVKNINVEDTKPTENTVNSFLLNLSSIIFVVNTLPQKTIVIGFDKVNINPCINILLDVGSKFNPGIIFILKTFNIILIPKITSTIEPIILNAFFTFGLSNILLTPRLAKIM